MDAFPVSLPSKEQLAPLVKRFGLRFVVLFGSVARGRTHRESDIDVGVLTERPLTFNQRLKLWHELSSLFHAEIDLAVLNHASPLFGFAVARDGRLLYERDAYAWKNWRSYKTRQYWDTTKFRVAMKGYLARRVRELDNVA